MSTLHLDVMDYVVLVVILLVPVAMAVVLRFTGAKLKTTSDVLMGSRQMSCVPVAISLAISYISGTCNLGTDRAQILQGGKQTDVMCPCSHLSGHIIYLRYVSDLGSIPELISN